jgi:hypothetical protein
LTASYNSASLSNLSIYLNTEKIYWCYNKTNFNVVVNQRKILTPAVRKQLNPVLQNSDALFGRN